jgi:ribosomal protein L11 methyltransferase
MNYIQISLEADQDQRNILIALLDEAGFEGFEEKDAALLAFIPQERFEPSSLDGILAPFGIMPEVEIVEKRNWNIDWESNFSPVIVKDFCTVRAEFHDIKVDTPYEIIITPKMSFGTGHHATTRLMMALMSRMDIKGQKVLDFGTGTGILAVLADKLGAAAVLGIDNEDWSFENANENVKRNGSKAVDIKLGSLEIASGSSFNIILANINRHILLEYMSVLSEMLEPNGQLLLSGLLKEDRDIIAAAAAGCGMEFQEEAELDRWIALRFHKPA